VAGLASTGGTVATSDDDLKRLYQKLRNEVERDEAKKVLLVRTAAWDRQNKCRI